MFGVINFSVFKMRSSKTAKQNYNCSKDYYEVSRETNFSFNKYGRRQPYMLYKTNILKFWKIFIKTCKENVQFFHKVSGRGTPNNFSKLFQKITD